MYKDKKFIKLLVTIVDRGLGQRIAEICNREHIHFHFLCFGLGTANSQILDYLGLGETEKDVIISMTPSSSISSLLSTISKEMNLKKPGKGIAFTIPISGISSAFSQILTKSEITENESEAIKMEDNGKYSIIITIVNRGYTDVVMDVAKSAGASGGTMLDARGIGYEEAENFLGISIQAEKNILAILCKKEDKNNIMHAISESAGIKTEAKGIVLSLSVDDIIGLNL